MKSKDVVIFKKILDYCRQVEEAEAMFGKDYDTFAASSVFQNACCMCVLQIGELCKALSPEAREGHPEIPWREWCGIRDIFAHQYFNLDLRSAWDTIVEDLPELRSNISNILAQ